MHENLTKLALLSQRINRRHVQTIFVIVSLAMLILGIGAPADGGGPTRAKVLLGL